jgi:hypothetical protein
MKNVGIFYDSFIYLFLSVTTKKKTDSAKLFIRFSLNSTVNYTEIFICHQRNFDISNISFLFNFLHQFKWLDYGGASIGCALEILDFPWFSMEILKLQSNYQFIAINSIFGRSPFSAL